MSPEPTLSSAVNVSEGRRTEVIDALAGAAASQAQVLDVYPDADHNRTVVTALRAGARRWSMRSSSLSAVAVSQIDLTTHEGVHPRLGAVDVVPFTPRPDASMQDADRAAHACAARLWAELAIPCFLYESSAATPERAALPRIRRSAFLSLAPDVGGPEPHPTAGASVVGARGPLVAFNVNLASEDLTLARSIAAQIRSPSVRALGLPLAARSRVQVSMNLTRPAETTVWDAFRLVRDLAGRTGVEVESSEVLGVVNEIDLGTDDFEPLRLRRRPKTFESIGRAEET